MKLQVVGVTGIAGKTANIGDRTCETIRKSEGSQTSPWQQKRFQNVIVVDAGHIMSVLMKHFSKVRISPN